jgi:hypothetical protein
VCYNILAAIESRRDVSILQVRISLVHARCYALRDQCNINVNLLPRPARQGSVAVIVKPKFHQASFGRPFNLVIDQPFTYWLAAVA